MQRIYIKEEVVEAIQHTDYITIYINWHDRSFPINVTGPLQKAVVIRNIDEEILSNGFIEVYDYRPEQNFVLIKEAIT